MFTRKTTLPLDQQVFLFVIGIFLLHIGWEIWLGFLGRTQAELFFTSRDIFADSIKVALAERAVSGRLLTDPRVHQWPALFQDYLFRNPYISTTLTVYLLPPLSTLLAMGIASLIAATSPLTALGALVFVYLLLVLLVHSLAVKQNWLPWLLVASYPALFMLDRGNFFSGLASIGLILYMLATVSGRFRWLGVVGLVCAVNIRPNLVIASLFECLMVRPATALVRRLLTIGGISALVGGIALGVAHAVDGGYSPQSFLHGYGLYRTGYIIGDGGLGWNDSLYGAIRVIRALNHLPPYAAMLSTLVSVLGAFACLAYTIIALSKRATPTEGCYLLTVLCGLFTPVDCEYHILAMLAPLLVLFASNGAREQPLSMKLFPFFGSSAALLCLLAWVLPFLAQSGLFALVLVVIVLLAARLNDQPMTSITRTETVIILTSALALCPLGDDLTNGLTVAALLSFGCLYVLAACLQRPAAWP